MELPVSGVHEVPGSTRAFLIDGDDGVVIIDTGLPKKESAVMDALTRVGRSPSDVRAILLTHSHSDHAGSAAAVKQATGAPVYASPADAPAIQGQEPSPPPPIMDRLWLLKPMLRFLPGAADVEVDHLIGAGETADLPEDLRVIDTPGHTPGHVSFLLQRDGGVLFTGDAAVANRRGDVRRGWMNASTPSLDASIRHLAEHEFDVAVFGHSGPLTSRASSAFARFASTLG